jgi:hypothetical protein
LADERPVGATGGNGSRHGVWIGINANQPERIGGKQMPARKIATTHR